MTFPCKEGQGSHKRGNRNGKQSICMYSPCPVHQGPSRASGLLPFPDEGRGDASRLTAIIPIRQASRTREIGRRGNFPDVFTILTTSSPSHLHLAIRAGSLPDPAARAEIDTLSGQRWAWLLCPPSLMRLLLKTVWVGWLIDDAQPKVSVEEVIES